MYIEERHQAILAIIEREGSISTGRIQKEFGVGYDSAKRDLRILEEKGMLRRTHGGAIPLGQLAIGKHVSIAARDTAEVRPNYMAIARRAVSMIEKNDVIFLASPAIGRLMAQNLPRDCKLRAATNSIDIAEELHRRDDIHVILIGGEMDERGSCSDGFAAEMLRRLRFDKAFVTSDGISAGFGLSIQHSSAIPFWNAVMESSRCTVGLYPSEKIGAESVVSICRASRLDVLITDDAANGEKLAEFEEMGTTVVIAE